MPYYGLSGGRPPVCRPVRRGPPLAGAAWGRHDDAVRRKPRRVYCLTFEQEYQRGITP